jgi:hypothetical protein
LTASNATTQAGGIPVLEDPVPAKKCGRPRHVRRTVRALVELARSRRSLAHVPTLMQVRAMAHFDGREPRSYPIDEAGDVLAEMPVGGEDPRGRHALRFTGSYPDSGRRYELLALPDGCAFDLLGMDG